jgi:hypothetical protein
MWGQEKASGVFHSRTQIPQGAGYVTVSGRGWEGGRAALCIDDCEAPVALSRMGDSLRGAATFLPAARAQLRLQADAPPDEIVIGAYARPYPSDRWRSVLPACLFHPNPAAQASGRELEEATETGADEPLSAALAEIAADCLSGPLEGQRALALLRRLAAHPLDRSPGLGALVGALCRKGSAL